MGLGDMGWSLNYVNQLIARKASGPRKYEEEEIMGKIALVTGANSGIGKEVALNLAKRGAHVILACRNLTEGQKALDEIKEKCEGKNENLFLMQLDLGDFESIRKFAEEVKKKFPKIHILVNNAGVFNITDPNMKTAQGHEANFGVNHLGHFLMTNLILDCLKNAAPSRIVIVSSTYLMKNKLDFDDLMLEKHPNQIVVSAYDNSKYANALFGLELGKRLEGTDVKTFSICPGFVSSNAFRHMTPAQTFFNKIKLATLALSAEQGAETPTYCSVSKECGELPTGQFYRFNKFNPCVTSHLKKEDAEKLWTESEKLVGLNG